MTIEPTAFLAKMEKRIGFTVDDKAILKSSADWGKANASVMADHFYAYLERDEEMSAILNAQEGRMHRLHETFIQWFHEMFTGVDDWSEKYAKIRWHIGLVHVKIGIAPQHVVPAMAVVVNEVGKQLRTDDKAESLQEALGKICMIDLAFIEQAYVEVSSSAVLRETGWSEALFKRLIATGVSSM
ncbi:MAG: hypothetical protein EAZ77_08330 [Nostocales cyanobacterium]|nr:MAG: hypothetical protein EAZ77_08330 [Nostocales cyanobacterium]